jgi:hypothetical protein
MRKRVNDLQPDLFLERLHAADVVEIDLRPLDLLDPLVVRQIALPHAAIDDLALLIGRTNPQPLGQLAVGRLGILLQAELVLRDGPRDVAGMQQQPRIKHVGCSRRLAVANQILQHHQRRAPLLLRMKGPRQPQLEQAIAGRQLESLLELGLGLLRLAAAQQRFGQVPAQRHIVRRKPQRFAQGIEGVRQGWSW